MSSSPEDTYKNYLNNKFREEFRIDKFRASLRILSIANISGSSTQMLPNQLKTAERVKRVWNCFLSNWNYGKGIK